MSEDVCTIKSFVLQTVFYFQSDVKGVLSEVSLGQVSLSKVCLPLGIC